MAEWHPVAKTDEIPAGQGRAFSVGDRTLALYNDGGSFYALDDTCPHAGASLSAGQFDEKDRCIICPWHAWAFEVESGQCPDNREIAVRRHEARVVNGRVQARWVET